MSTIFDQLKAQIDSDIINKTTAGSIEPGDVGENMKALADVVDDNFQPKQAGKGLSTNDYTNGEKTKLASLPTSPVISVNGKTGAVVLNANDVNADEAGVASDIMVAHINDDDPHAQYLSNATDTYTSTPLAKNNVTLTEVEYNAIAVPDSNTLYYCT